MLITQHNVPNKKFAQRSDVIILLNILLGKRKQKFQFVRYKHLCECHRQVENSKISEI